MNGAVHRVALSGATIHYESVGAGRPLVLLHGLSGSTRWWSRNVPVLARRHRVFTIDLIGFGRSRGRRRFLLHEAREVLHEWWVALRLPPCDWIGHSMGGRIVVELAAAFPSAVRRMVLVDAALRIAGIGVHRRAWGLFREARRVPFSLAPIVVGDTLRAGPLTMLRAIHDLVAADMTVQLESIHRPALVVWGARDRVVPRAVGEAIHRELPGSRLLVIPDTGHVPMWERPAVFNRAVLEFLDGAGEPAAAPEPAASRAAGPGCG